MEELVCHVVEAVVEFFNNDEFSRALTFVKFVSIAHDLKHRLTKDDVAEEITDPSLDEDEGEVTASNEDRDEET